MDLSRHYHIIGACSCWGAQIRACERGPEVCRERGLFERLRQQGVALADVEMLYPSQRAIEGTVPLARAIALVHEFNLRLVEAVRRALRQGLFPIVMGGDHSIAVGTWNAFTPPFGLLWIDAHMDSHTPETTPSGAYHGMPLAGLLGYGAPEMAKLIQSQALLAPRNVVLIGVRSFEEGEAALLKRLNVRVYLMEEVRQRGLVPIFHEALAYLAETTPRYGISLDLDVFALEEAPGVGSPEPGGILKRDLLPLLAQCGKDSRLMGLELVEFNPERDPDHRTCELLFEILTEMTKPW